MDEINLDMNDFTKEELQTIHLDMTIYVNRTPMLKESPIHKELRDKIQSMIDNYCEHEIKSCIDCDKLKETKIDDGLTHYFSCFHPDRQFVENIIFNARTGFTEIPAWCPLLEKE